MNSSAQNEHTGRLNQAKTRIEIQLRESGALPPLAETALRMGISLSTVRRAVQALQAEGKAVVRQGKGVYAPQNAPPHKSVSSLPNGPGNRTVARDSENKEKSDVAEWLRSRMLDGTLRAGNPLPKSAFLCLEFGASPNTIAAAMRRLCEESLIHKRGRSWYAGPLQESGTWDGRTGGRSRRNLRPMVLLVQKTHQDWRNLYLHHRDGGTFSTFISTFENECNQCGVRLMPLAIESADGQSASSLFESMLRNSGGYYLGALILGSMRGTPLSSFGQWVDPLLSYRKPVIVLGPTYAAPPTPSPIASPGAAWCQGDPDAIAGLLLDHLVERGHHHIGFPLFHFHRHWAIHLVRALRRAAAGRTDAPRMRVFEESPGLFPPGLDPEGVMARFRQIRKSGSAPARSALSELEKRIPGFDRFFARQWSREGGGPHFFLSPEVEELFSQLWMEGALGPLLEDKHITAIIAPGDRYARYIWSYLSKTGLRIPQDISLISPEDSPQLYPYPITAADSGMSSLGYQAAHYLFGDVPVRLAPGLRLTARHTLIDRGSVRSGARSRGGAHRKDLS